MSRFYIENLKGERVAVPDHTMPGGTKVPADDWVRVTVLDALTREVIAKAIWEASHPNPPGWAAWHDRSSWGPSHAERMYTYRQTDAVIALLRKHHVEVSP